MNDGIFSLKLNPNFKYTIVHQIPNLSDLPKYESKKNELKKIGVNYVQSNTSGLSISRNIGIENATGDYIWIMDDDVEIYSDAKEVLQKYIVNHNADIYVLNYDSDKKKIQHNYLYEKKLNYLSTMSVSSIKMLIKRTAIGSMRFDEDFGLGGKFPSGEEYIFCCNMLKQDKIIWQTNLTTCFHPSVTSGQDFYSTPLKLATKKHMFMRAHNTYIGFFLYILFLIKKLPTITKNKAIKNIIKSFKL
ncbi:glycosyltransferase [Wohlfahrtiimonas sp. G9077]|uniref:glycosyltransferase n=1 Tax=Wohlfahrtiimonas sp. G9077 TaxID=1980118 RepID=UPI001314A5DB|nr:glycosyltransferase [Wohlfahrtiimonas sp. G9077]